MTTTAWGGDVNATLTAKAGHDGEPSPLAGPASPPCTPHLIAGDCGICRLDQALAAARARVGVAS